MPTIDEKELEDFLMEDEDRLVYIGIDPTPHTQVFRQLSLGSYGTADIVAVSPEDGPDGQFFRVTIVEVKKGDVDVNALIQAARYRVGFIHHFKKYWDGGKPPRIYVSITLVGSHVNLGDWVYLGDLLAYVPIFTYKLSLSEGIEFRESPLRGYTQSDPQYPKTFTGVMEQCDESMDAFQVYLSGRGEAKEKALPAPESKTQAAEFTQADEAPSNG